MAVQADKQSNNHAAPELAKKPRLGCRRYLRLVSVTVMPLSYWWGVTENWPVGVIAEVDA